ncbi:MAG: hypothetical protein H6658_03570 [Ardenticatenaceae bacterium]|nr:hypothetical protein [Ardenticatenaceae bacterium]
MTHHAITDNICIALPGHGPLIYDLRGKIRELERHHDERLTAMATAVYGSATSYHISQHVFNFDKLSIHKNVLPSPRP